MRKITRAVLLAMTAGAAGPLTAQDEGQEALAACIAAAQAGNEAEAGPAARRASAAFRARIQEAPGDVGARVALAQVGSRCEIPFAPMMDKLALLDEANGLLTEALGLDSLHWEARFALAMNHFHTPPFLRRGPDAERELLTLLRLQGDDARAPHLAGPHLYLGDLYRRDNRMEEARAAWERGARLFPADGRFRERLAGGAPGGGGGGVAAARVQPNGSGGRAIALPAVVVDGGSRLDDARNPVAVRRMDVFMTPGGTADLMHSLQTLPGTTRAGEGTDLYVRGGDPAESPVWVDGARLFYAGRFESLHGGVFGVLDPATVRTAYFAAGGFSARYGDALSGVLDVETLARPSVRTTRVNLSTASAQVGVQGPTGTTTGIWASARATDTRLMLAMHDRTADFAQAPRSLEALLGAAWEPRPGVAVRLTAMADGDEVARQTDAYGHQGPFRAHGGSRLVSLSARAVRPDGRASVRGSVSGSSRAAGFEFGVLDREQRERGLATRLDGDLLAGATRLRTGVEARWMESRLEGRVPTTGQLAPGAPSRELDEADDDGRHLGGYVEAERPLGSSLALVGGVRADRLPGEESWSVDPRAALAVRAVAWTLRLGGGVFHQGRWRTRYRMADDGAPQGTPRRAGHLVAAAERRGDPAVRVEAYWKRYGSYVPAGDAAAPRITAGRAAGVDAIVRWEGDRRLKGWITYSLLQGRVRLADGGEAPSAVDVTHSVTGVARWSVRRGWELGTTARLATGRPYTPLARVEAGEPTWGAPNGGRMPTYRRLDARITRYLPGRRGPGVLFVEVLNVLDTPNVAAYSYAADYSARRETPAFFADRTLVFGTAVTF